MELVDRYRELGAKQFGRWVLIKRIGKPIVRSIDRLMASQSLVGNPEIYDKRLFPWVAELEASVPEIRAELDRLLQHRDRLPRVVATPPDPAQSKPDAG